MDVLLRLLLELVQLKSQPVGLVKLRFLTATRNESVSASYVC